MWVPKLKDFIYKSANENVSCNTQQKLKNLYMSHTNFK